MITRAAQGQPRVTGVKALTGTAEMSEIGADNTSAVTVFVRADLLRVSCTSYMVCLKMLAGQPQMRNGNAQCGAEPKVARQGWNGVPSRALAFSGLGHLHPKSGESSGLRLSEILHNRQNRRFPVPGGCITSG